MTDSLDDLAAKVREGAHFLMAHKGHESPHEADPDITVWTHDGTDCPGCAAEAALAALLARAKEAEQALGLWDRTWPLHRNECSPFSGQGCVCGLDEARQMTRAALARIRSTEQGGQG